MTPARRRMAIALALLAELPGIARAQRPQTGIAITAPAAPGGGWDQLARTLARLLDSTGLAKGTHVDNIPGAAGTIGLARFVSGQRGDPNALLITGLVMLGGIASNKSPVTLAKTTPLARLTGEYEVLAVPASSPIASLGDLLSTLRRTPGVVSWGGGSAGGTDQMLVDLIAAQVGVDASRTRYVAFAGGGEAVTALLGGQVTVGVSGYGEFAPHIGSGQLRALAISAPRRQPGVDVPTLRELGVPVELANWRGVVAPPGISPADRAQMIATLEQLVQSPLWKSELARRGWSDLWLPGEAFTRFLGSETRRVEDLARRRQVGPQAAGVPRVSLATVGVFGTLAALGVLLAGAARGRAYLPAVSTEQPPRRKALAQIALGMLLNLALAPWSGFILASAVLFYLTARAFGDGKRGRTAVVAVLFSAAVFALFRFVLGLALPVGWWWTGSA
ncbi:MAG: tripartite tricarboxylate transporter substrate-binding protein [Gemmatimonadaceae bacterium]